MVNKELSMNVFELSNVVLSEKVRARNPDLVKSNMTMWSGLRPVIEKLVTMYPLWTFEVADVITAYSETAVGFSVSEYGEKLGTIMRVYHGNDYCVGVSNERIEKSMSRGGTYRTKDPLKALAKIKKTFVRANISERVEKAHKLASGVLYSQLYNMERNMRNDKYKIEKSAQEFIMGKGYHLFLDYVNELPPTESEPLLKAMENKANAEVEMVTIEGMKAKFQDDKMALIVRDAGKYLVKVDDNVQIYDDNTLPESYRGKLGMLKLVEPEHFITGIGCRASDEVFVITVDTQEGEVA
jgi:hypothetical protein